MGKAKFIKIKVGEKITSFIKENFNEDLKYFENKNKIKIELVSDNNLIFPDHSIELLNKSKKIIEKIDSISKLKNLNLINNNYENIKNIDKKGKFKKNNFKKKKFYKKKFYKKSRSSPLLAK